MLYALLGSFLATASTDASYSVSAAGGMLGSVSSMDVLGLYVNPASAVTESTEFKIDVAFMAFGLGFDMEGPEEDMLREKYGGSLPEGWNPISGQYSYKGTSPLGSFGVAIPLAKGWHLGLESFVPYGKSAVLDTDSPLRFYTTAGQLIWAEQNVVLARRVQLEGSELRVGAALRAGYLTVRRQNAQDTGALLYQLGGGDNAILDPMLEGTQEIEGSGIATGYALGAHWNFSKFGVHMAHRSYVAVDVSGTLMMRPSNSIQAFLQGDISTRVGLPAETYFGLSVPVSIVQVEADAGVTRWSNNRYSSAQLSNVEIGADSEGLQSLLEAYGFTDGDSLGLNRRQDFDTGAVDSYFFRLGGWVSLNEQWDIFSRVGYSTSTIPVSYSTPAAYDFNAVNTSLATIWTPTGRFSFGLSGLYIFRPNLVVTDSVYSPTNLESQGNSGNGEYRFTLGRIALTTHIRL